MKYAFQSPPKNLCILRLSAIGDVSHVIPTLHILQKNWPNTKITWIIGKTEFGLVKDIPNIEFILFDKSKGWKAHFDLWKTLSDRKFDLLLHMQASLRASLASLAVKAPIRLGFDRKRAKNYQWLFSNQKIAATPRQHVLNSFLEFPKKLGMKTDKLIWDIPIPETSKRKVKKLLPQGKTILAINPCSSMRIRNYRNWNIESYAKIIDFAYEKYALTTVLTGGTSKMETEYAAAIAEKATAKPINLVGKTTLKELLAVLKIATIAISPDTGPAHLANAVGTPVIGLYATSNPDRTGPYMNRELTVNKYQVAVQKELKKTVDKIPWGKRVRNPKAMDMIAIEDVKEKLQLAVTSPRVTIYIDSSID